MEAWNSIKEKGPEIGLFVNNPKCDLIFASGCDDCFKQFKQEMIRVADSNMSMLGSPISAQSHFSAWVSDKLHKKCPYLSRSLKVWMVLNPLFFSCFIVCASVKWFGTFKPFLLI